mgnify:CR=1 FL=1
MSKIYEQHTAAFANVSAYVVLKDGELVAKIAFKFPKDGAGRLYAYVHWLGSEMVRGSASGYGYDKRSAAVADAAHKVKLDDREDGHRDDYGNAVTDCAEFIDAVSKDGGKYWNDKLRDAGFTVIQAV